MLRTVSDVASVGDRAVKLNEVNGKVLGFGFPASRDIRPGVSSNGKRERTDVEIVSRSEVPC